MQNDMQSGKPRCALAGQSPPCARAESHCANLGLELLKLKPGVWMKPKNSAAEQCELWRKLLPPQSPASARATRRGSCVDGKFLLQQRCTVNLLIAAEPLDGIFVSGTRGERARLHTLHSSLRKWSLSVIESSIVTIRHEHGITPCVELRGRNVWHKVRQQVWRRAWSKRKLCKRHMVLWI
eukprot:1432274-Amphidinium_carterae.2